MEKITVQGQSGMSQLFIGELIKDISDYLPQGKIIIITDEQVNSLYSAIFQSYDIILIGQGEQMKTLSTVESVYDRLQELEVDRSTFILGVGGGMVCDVAGFVSSTYLRGLPFGFVPTTLLAQVDASVGGKNGVNFSGFKNRIGTINQPQFVLCDSTFFNTLPEREFRSGLGEVVKHALIADTDMFNYIEEHIDDILALNPYAMQRLVLDSLRIKSAVVSRDEREQGERRLLNFGHTVGHIIEEHSLLNHGEAVSVGMVIAAKISHHLGLLPNNDLQRIIKLLQRLGLPVTSPIPAEQIIQTLSMDKKCEDNHLHFVLLNNIGHAEIRKVSLLELQKLITHNLSSLLLTFNF